MKRLTGVVLLLVLSVNAFSTEDVKPPDGWVYMGTDPYGNHYFADEKLLLIGDKMVMGEFELNPVYMETLINYKTRQPPCRGQLCYSDYLSSIVVVSYNCQDPMVWKVIQRRYYSNKNGTGRVAGMESVMGPIPLPSGVSFRKRALPDNPHWSIALVLKQEEHACRLLAAGGKTRLDE